MLNQKQKDKIDSMFESGGLMSFWNSLRVSAAKADTQSKRKLLVDLLDYAIEKSCQHENKTPLKSMPALDQNESEDDEEPMRLFTYMNAQKTNP